MVVGTPFPGRAELAVGGRQPDTNRDGHDRRDDDGKPWSQYTRGRRTWHEPLFHDVDLRHRPAERRRAHDREGAWPWFSNDSRRAQDRPARVFVGGLRRSAVLADFVVERAAPGRDGG